MKGKGVLKGISRGKNRIRRGVIKERLEETRLMKKKILWRNMENCHSIVVSLMSLVTFSS